jgi:hypothetical protein
MLRKQYHMCDKSSTVVVNAGIQTKILPSFQHIHPHTAHARTHARTRTQGDGCHSDTHSTRLSYTGVDQSL